VLDEKILYGKFIFYTTQYIILNVESYSRQLLQMFIFLNRICELKGRENNDVFTGRDLVRNSALSRKKMDTTP